MSEFIPSPPHDITTEVNLPIHASPLIWGCLAVLIIGLAFYVVIRSLIKRREGAILSVFKSEVEQAYQSKTEIRHKLNDFARLIRRTLQIFYGEKFISLSSTEMEAIVSNRKLGKDLVRILTAIDYSRFSREPNSRVLDESLKQIRLIKNAPWHQFWRRDV